VAAHIRVLKDKILAISIQILVDIIAKLTGQLVMPRLLVLELPVVIHMLILVIYITNIPVQVKKQIWEMILQGLPIQISMMFKEVYSLFPWTNLQYIITNTMSIILEVVTNTKQYYSIVLIVLIIPKFCKTLMSSQLINDLILD